MRRWLLGTAPGTAWISDMISLGDREQLLFILQYAPFIRLRDAGLEITLKDAERFVWDFREAFPNETGGLLWQFSGGEEHYSVEELRVAKAYERTFLRMLNSLSVVEVPDEPVLLRRSEQGSEYIETAADLVWL